MVELVAVGEWSLERAPDQMRLGTAEWTAAVLWAKENRHKILRSNDNQSKIANNRDRAIAAQTTI